MIGFLSGNVIYSTNEQPHSTLIMTSGGIGYIVNTVNQFSTNSSVNIYTESITREDGTKLYGFESIIEKLIFNELIKINGISGKIAVVLLKYRSIDYFLHKSYSDESFEDIPGIGKKMSSVLKNEIPEIEKKIMKKKLNYDNLINSESLSRSSGENDSIMMPLGKIHDSIEVIKTLGIYNSKSREILNKILLNNPDFNTEEIVKEFMNIVYGN